MHRSCPFFIQCYERGRDFLFSQFSLRHFACLPQMGQYMKNASNTALQPEPINGADVQLAVTKLPRLRGLSFISLMKPDSTPISVNPKVNSFARVTPHPAVTTATAAAP